VPDNIDNEQTFSGESLKGNSLDVKIGYDKRAAAKRDLAVVLQDVEGSQLTDEAGNDLITEVEGFVTSELTSEKAVSVVVPDEVRLVSNFYTIVFGNTFEVKKSDSSRTPDFKKDAYVKVFNPDPTWRAIFKGSRIQIATGDPLLEDLDDDPSTPGLPDGHKFETFIVESVHEIPATSGLSVIRDSLGTVIYDYSSDNTSGNFEIQFNLSTDPSTETPTREVTYIRRLITKERTGTWKIEEVFPSTSEVSSTLLGIDRAETQLSLFSNVSTYGFNSDEFVFYTDNPPTGPTEWSNRPTENGERRYAATISEEKNEGALKISTYPVPYTFPYPPLVQNFDAQGNDTLGLYSPTGWPKWINFCKLGKSLWEYFRFLRDSEVPSDSPQSNYYKYGQLLTRFLPAVNLWDDKTYYNGLYYNDDPDRYYLQVDIWTRTYQKIVAGNELVNPVSGDYIKFADIQSLLEGAAIPVDNDPTSSGTTPVKYDINGSFTLTGLDLRGTGLDLRENAGSIETGTPGSHQVLNPYKETWINKPFQEASQSQNPSSDDFVPGYSPVGGQYALLQSRQAFRYQPGRISGYTYGTRAFMDKTEGSNYGEWGIFNDFDEYVFRREGANFYIIRRSNIPYDTKMLQELGVADDLGQVDPSFVQTYQKTIAGTNYTMQEVKLGKEKFNGDSLNGNGPSGYLLNTDEITMYKIEFGWYGAIGLRMYAYIPVEHGKARWVVVHTFVIENKLDVPSMGDPFFRFKYEVRIGSGQAPDLVSPQVLYKYGTSMYIDGGDEGTVNVYSETSDVKQLGSSGDYTTLMGIYPKTNITSGGGVDIPNKKIIIPKQVSVTADGFCELNFTKCTACRGNGFVYMPNITANQNGQIRRLKKIDPDGTFDTLILEPLTFTTQAPTADTGTVITVDSGFINLIRTGDVVLGSYNGNVNADNIVGGKILSIVANGNNYDLTMDQPQGDQSGNGIPNGATVTVQPVFIVDELTRAAANLDVGDYKAKVIYEKIWNTYIGNNLGAASNAITGSSVDMLMYVQGDRHELKYARKLDPTKIIANQDTEPFPPAEFFGTSGTFDVRLSQKSMIAASPNAVSGPISYFKFLNPVPQESGGQKANWRMGFTPHRPQYNALTGELTGWLKADTNWTQPLTELRNGSVVNVTVLPESEYVYLDYHQYNQEISYRGLEQGEGWFGRIHPFYQDFRIGNPKGSYSGYCSEIKLDKNDPSTVTCIERTATELGTINPNNGAEPRWSNLDNTTIAPYLAKSTYFLQSEAPIYTGNKSPENGQLAVFANNVFIKSVFVDNDGNAADYETEVFIRFAGEQQTYTNTPTGGNQTTYYTIPIKLFKVSDGTEVTTPLSDAKFTSTGTGSVSAGIGTQFSVGYNSVTMRAWFQQIADGTGRYDTPNSYTPGIGGTGVFEFDAFPLYAFMELYDSSVVYSGEIHDINLLGDVSTKNPQWKINQIDGVNSGTYNAGTNNQTGELDVNGNGSISQTPSGIDELVPPAFTQVNRLSSSQVDRQAESLLRPGNTMTTLYINDETKMFDLTDIFGFDRKVITPDIVNTEAVFVTGRALDGTNIDVTINITYVEQL